MIKINAKSTLIKTLILVMISALMLSTSTYAWFSSGATVSVDQIIASFGGETEQNTFDIFEAIDANYNGVRDPEEQYGAYSGGTTISIQMQPGKVNFYKFGVLTLEGVTSSVLMKNIVIDSGGSSVTDETVLKSIKFRIGNTGEYTTLWDSIDNTSSSPYTVTLATGVTNANLYLDIGLFSTVELSSGLPGVVFTCDIGLYAQSAT